MRYPHRVLLSLPIFAVVVALSGCGNAFLSSTNPSNSSGSAPAVVATGEQVNGVAPNRWQYVQFNEAMDPSTINNQTFIVADSSGNPAPGTVTYNANYEIAGFMPNPALAANTTYTLTVTTGVASAQGVHMAAAYTSRFTTRASDDTSPIYVKSVTPLPDASCVSATTPITITFNEGADVSTINSSDIMITGTGGAAIQAKMGYNPATATVTLTPTAALPSGTITVTVQNVADAAGVAMTSRYMWSFTTACGGGGGTTTEFIATILSAGGTPMVHGQVTIDTAGNATAKLTNATASTTYTVQFCSAINSSGAGITTNPTPDCFNVMTISTDAGGNATATAKFPKAGDWAGDFYINNSARKAQYGTYLVPGLSNETYMARLIPDNLANGGAVQTTTGPQAPLTRGSVSYSNGSLQFTVEETSPNTTFYANDSETIYMDSSGTYSQGQFTTDAQGNGSLTTTLNNGPGGDLFQVVPQDMKSNGFIGGFSINPY